MLKLLLSLPAIISGLISAAFTAVIFYGLQYIDKLACLGPFDWMHEKCGIPAALLGENSAYAQAAAIDVVVAAVIASVLAAIIAKKGLDVSAIIGGVIGGAISAVVSAAIVWCLVSLTEIDVSCAFFTALIATVVVNVYVGGKLGGKK